MKPTSFISSSKRLLLERRMLGFLARLIVFGLVLACLDRAFVFFDEKTEDVFTSLRRAKIAQIEHVFSTDCPRFDTICLGSSHAKFGFDPATYASLAGGTAFNAGLGGSVSPVESLAILRQTLEHTAPTTVIFCIDSFGMNSLPTGPMTGALNDRTSREILFLMNAGRFASNFWRFWKELSTEGWQTAQRSIDPYDTTPFIQYDRHELRDNGWVAAYGMARPEYLRYSQTSFAPLALNWQALREIHEVCQQKKIRLVLVQVPEYYTARAARPDRYEAFDQAIRKFAAEQQVEYYDFNRVDRFPLRKLELFFDSDHLNAQGAAKFSRQLAETLTGSIPAETPDRHDYRAPIYQAIVQFRSTKPTKLLVKTVSVGNDHRDVWKIDFTRDQEWRRCTAGLNRRMWNGIPSQSTPGRPLVLDTAHPSGMLWTSYEVTSAEDGALQVGIDVTLPEPLAEDVQIECVDLKSGQFVPWCTLAKGCVGTIRKRVPLPQPFPGSSSGVAVASRIEAPSSSPEQVQLR